MSKYTFKQFQAQYPDDGACLDRIMQEQFGGTELTCPGCDTYAKFHRMSERRGYACQKCGHHIYPCVGTVFEKSRTPLTNWFFAMYLMTSTRHGVAAKELQRQIGCTYKCAWRMASELRKLMAAADDHTPMGGHVEIDETYIGGKQAATERKRRGTNKTVVMGIVERGDGRLRAAPIPDTTADSLLRLIDYNVVDGSTISTDEWRGYDMLKVSGYKHGTVNHSAKEYVRGEHHTNTIEGHWSLFKRAIRGTHTHVSPKHLWKYVCEFSYRRNMRHSHWLMFDHLLVSLSRPLPQAG